MVMDFASVFELGWTDVLIVAFMIYVIYRILSRKDQPIPATPVLPQPMKKRDFTVTELLEYNGVDNERILLAICDKVELKSVSWPYSKLAGHDATRALATMDTEKVKDEYDDVSDLPPYELNEAKEWGESLACKFL
ncbi:unnamed protein product [Toxocara canis]|uniref:DUF4332 domain-containing protein n=1 Tax=Toxocara canis TaxID=6265 RepID=A0A183UJJ6_TOXCA|nr:unnamed protein product [Toxocara canis]